MTPCGKSLRSLPREPRGFALVLTVTLLAFLVLILVALATLTRIETQVAGNHQQLAQARQNALMALNIALGQLQKYAGPDQRVTATADLAGGVGGARLPDGLAPANTQSPSSAVSAPGVVNGLGPVHAGTRFWTGIWGSSRSAFPLVGNGNLYEATPVPVLLNWLVSGNEAATFTASTAADTFGRATAGAAIAYTPAASVAGLRPDMSGTDPVTINGLPAVVLIGSKTAGASSRALSDSSSESAVDRYVAAPLVPIHAPAGSIPGTAGSGELLTGRYAYWVGDEGVKARINLADRYAGKLDAASDQEARYRLMTVPRSGLEALADFKDSLYAARTQSANPVDNVAPRALALAQVAFLDTNSLTTERLRQRIHDFTTHAFGLEADSLHGGLRRDLTHYFEQPTLPIWTGTNGLPAGAGQPIIPTAYSPTGTAGTYGAFPAPQWDVLRDFYNAPVVVSSAADPGTVNIRPATPTQMGIAPVITLFRLQLGVRRTASEFFGLAAPLITLANPYTTKLAAPDGLSLEILYSDEGDPDISGKDAAAHYPKVLLKLIRMDSNGDGVVNLEGDDRNKDGKLTNLDYDPKKNDTGDAYVHIFTTRANNNALLSNVKFMIPAGTIWQPGEAKLFSLRSGNVSVGSMGAPRTVALAEGIDSGLRFNAVVSPARPVDATAAVSIDERDKDTYSYSEKGSIVLTLLELRDPKTDRIVQAIDGINFNIVGGVGVSTPPSEALDARVVNVLEASLFSPGDVAENYNQTNSKLYGVRNTALRLYQDFNPRAAFFRLTNRAYSVAPYNYQLAVTNEIVGVVDGDLAEPFTDNVEFSNPQPWGRAVRDTSGTMAAVLYDLPRRASAADMPVLSLGQLQHANLTADDRRLNVGHQPGYAVGNSYASPFVARAGAFETRPDLVYTTYDKDGRYTATESRRYFDLSYLLNASLWDGYFFSTIPQTASMGASGSRPLPANPRLQLIDMPEATVANMLDGERAAAHTAIVGAFNVNSTSIEAWAAVLGGMKSLPALPTAPSATPEAIFPRTIRQSTAGSSAPSGDGADSYSGFRQLTDAQIQTLAAHIVREVRRRGPFVSLAHFINRSLLPTMSDTSGAGLSGPLQSAIDAGAALNAFSAGVAANDRVKIPDYNANPAQTDLASADVGHNDPPRRGTWSLYAEGTGFDDGAAPPLARSTGIPGWLTQADLLQAIGPIISARSDTFIIRAYGEVHDPVNSTDVAPAITGRAWCEAIVQRLPDYVESSVVAGGTGNAPSDAPNQLTPTNEFLGRRFRIVSFRWLGPDDI